MAKTTGDELFERYLRQHGCEPGPHEPDLSAYGIRKRPDFLPTWNDVQIACEVEQFKPGATKLEKRLLIQPTVSASSREVHRSIRNHVAKAASQLKPLRSLGIPLVVVLANPDRAIVPLSVEQVLAALYGDLTFKIPIDPAPAGAAIAEGRLEFGRNGKLTNDHLYISAVALLRRREHRVDRLKEIVAEERVKGGPSDLGDAVEEMWDLLGRLESEELPAGDYVFVDVIETISDNAVPLPAEWFSGPRDRRFRLGPDRRFEQVLF